MFARIVTKLLVALALCGALSGAEAQTKINANQINGLIPCAGTPAIGDIFYATSGTTCGFLSDIATGNVLISGGVATPWTAGKVGISTHVSGLGTGVATALAANANASGGLVTDSGTVALTNKRITARVVSMSDATSFTPTGDTANMNTQANTQSTGTLTVNAPSGTPTDGQGILIRIKSTNVQTYSWNAIYRGSTSAALPTASSGAGKTDYIAFTYNSADSKWDYTGTMAGF